MKKLLIKHLDRYYYINKTSLKETDGDVACSIEKVSKSLATIFGVGDEYSRDKLIMWLKDQGATPNFILENDNDFSVMCQDMSAFYDITAELAMDVDTYILESVMALSDNDSRVAIAEINNNERNDNHKWKDRVRARGPDKETQRPSRLEEDCYGIL